MSINIEIPGTVEHIFDLQTFPSGFSKREVVILTDDDKYPQSIKIGFNKDKANLLSTLVLGQSVTIQANLQGSEYNGKFYVNLNGWKLETDGTVRETQVRQTAAGGQAIPNGADKGWDDVDEDAIPF